MRTPVRGFSIVELMITLTIAAIMAGVAAPSVRDMIFNNRISTAANDLVVDVSTARSESARRRARVTLCKNSSGTNANIACDPTASWSNGWIMFIDTNNNGSRDTGEEILRVRQPLPTGLVVTVAGIGSTLQAKPVGSVTPAGSWKVCDSRTGNFGRLISVSVTGRAASSTTNCP